VEIVFLEPEDAEYVETLAQHHYPPDFNLSFEDIVSNLEKNDKSSFCFGVEAEGKLVGYLMAWIDNTMVEGRRERVVLVDDIVLSTRARSQLYRLIQTMCQQMEERGFGKLPIEGSARPTSTNTFMGHPETLERLGYELVSKAEYYEEDFDETLTWVRFEPIAREEATIDTDDYLEIEFEESEPLDEEEDWEDEEEWDSEEW